MKWIVDHTTILSLVISTIATCMVAIYTALLKLSTDKLWRSSDRQHAVSNRAFVYLDGFNYELTTALDAKIDLKLLPERYKTCPELYITRFACQPRWKNGGNTATKNMTIRVHWRGPVGPIPPVYEYPHPSEPLFLAPRAVEPSAYFEMPNARALVHYGLEPEGDEPMLFIWGRADYEDIFGQKHFIEWCNRVRFDRHDGETLRTTFTQYGSYNQSDEEKA